MDIEEVKRFRRELHQQPELSGKEKDTSKKIADRLRSLDPAELKTGVGGDGVMALFSGDRQQNEPREQIVFRAELDAIAVHEKSDLPYRSETDGVMHGCGHDGHMAIVIALAGKLHSKPLENLDVWLLFQPAEETGKGAEQVLEDPFFEKLDLKRMIALHNLPGFQENQIVIRDGVFAAASTGLKVVFKGSSSHASQPENGVNPALLMSKFVTFLEKKRDSFKKGSSVNNLVVTYMLLGERAFGISPGNGDIGVTVRSENPEDLEGIVSEIEEYINRESEHFDGELTFQREEPFTVTKNDSEGNQVVKSAARELNMDLLDLEEPFPWSEDFGQFGNVCPITFFGLGAGEEHPPLHSDRYDFNEELIQTGAEIFYKIAQQYDRQTHGT